MHVGQVWSIGYEREKECITCKECEIEKELTLTCRHVMEFTSGIKLVADEAAACWIYRVWMGWSDS